MEPTMSTPMSRPDLSDGMSRAQNMEFNFNGQSYLTSRAPDYWVYLYNVSEQTFEVSRPPILRRLVIPGRKVGEEYARVTKLPQPLLVPQGNIDSNELSLQSVDARRMMMDIVNPDNLGSTPEAQDAVIDPAKGTSSGTNNLGKRGVFWSLNAEPTKEEISKAVKRMEAHYNSLIEQARAVEVSAPATLKDILTPEHHAAAEYFAVEAGWHAKRSKVVECPNCGERMKQGAAFHKTEEGSLCILDWKRSVTSGIRTRQQAFEATGDSQFAPKE